MSVSDNSFSLSAAPGSDVWKKPPQWNVFDVPTRNTPTKSLSQFVSARVSFTANWLEQYDQGGLILVLDHVPGSQEKKWIKTGLEFYEKSHQLSTVACDRWADWSVTPLSAVGSGETITILIERDLSAQGSSVWVYYVGEDGTKAPLREICWVFGDDGTGKDWNLTVGAYAARPEKETTKENLSVNFKDLKVEWSD